MPAPTPVPSTPVPFNVAVVVQQPGGCALAASRIGVVAHKAEQCSAHQLLVFVCPLEVGRQTALVPWPDFSMHATVANVNLGLYRLLSILGRRCGVPRVVPSTQDTSGCAQRG